MSARTTTAVESGKASSAAGRKASTAGISAGDLAHRLREDIMAGRLVPNQRLIEADMTEEYGASRGNVRIALSELSVEGLIERVQNRGARVRAVSVDEAVEITEVRGAVEALCARKAAKRATPRQIDELRELGRRMEDAVRSGQLEVYSESNRQLHAKIIEMSGQSTAADTIKRLRGQAVRFQFKLSNRPGRPEESLPQPLAVVEAVCAHDPQAAERAMVEHLASVADEIRAIGG